MGDTRARAAVMMLAGCSVFAGPLAAQAEWTMAETRAWLETDAAELTRSSTETTINNGLMFLYVTSAVLRLDACSLSIAVTDNGGVNGFRSTMLVPLGEVNAGAVAVVVQSDRLVPHAEQTDPRTGRPVDPSTTEDVFRYRPARTYVSIPAFQPNTFPFVRVNDRGELREWLASIPAKNREAGDLLASAVRRAAVLCGAPAP